MAEDGKLSPDPDITVTDDDAAAGTLPTVDLTGTTLDRYRLTEIVGRGGMGTVYAAHDERLDRTVAVKVLHPGRLGARARERFLREARVAASLNHRNIVAVHDAGETSGRPYLVMEYVDGETLERTPPSSVEEIVRVAVQVCDALAHAHARGIVHRDLKPGNLLAAREGGRSVIKLGDLGVALGRDAARITRAGAIAGTPAYMSPEQVLGRPVDGRADLYSLGVMLYEWSAGRLPFRGDDALAVVSQHLHAPVVPPRTFRPELPAGLERIVLRLLAKQPEERFESPRSVREALESGDFAAGPESDGVFEAGLQGLTRGRLVGRREELKRLRGLWDSALGGSSHLVLLSGEPGVGKTRLALETTSMAQLDRAIVIAGGCYENEATTPYLPFLEAFRRFVRELDDDGLRALVRDSAAEIARLAPEIETRLGPFPGRPALSPEEERLRLFDAVARFLRRAAEPTGLLVSLDDLQWADHGSLGLLRYLLRQMKADRVLFVATYREIELDRTLPLARALVDWDRERLATRLKLEPLSPDETRTMIETLLGQEDAPEELAVRVHKETEGNPFFVEEILKALIAEGGLVRDRARWRRKRASGEFVLPQSVKAAVGSRLEKVGERCCEVLRMAAVVGKEFAFDELHAVAGGDEDALLDALDEAARAHLIAAGRRDTFRFTHDKIREVLYEESNPIRRRRAHLRIAEALERLERAGKDVAVEDLAYHFIESGDEEKGQAYAERAAQAAAALYAYEEALDMYDRARACADGLGRRRDAVRIDAASATVAMAAGKTSLAVELFERAMVGCEDEDRCRAMRAGCAEAYAVAGDPRGLEYARQALDGIDRERLPHTAALALAIEARYRHLAGELGPAVEGLQAAIPLAGKSGDVDLLVRVLSFLSGSLQHLSRFEESDAVARRCIEIGEKENTPTGVMLGYEFLHENAFYRGEWAQAVEYGEKEEALAVSTQAGERYGWAQFRGFPLLFCGRRDEAERVFRQGVEHAATQGDLRLELFLQGGLALVLSDAGKPSDAERKAREAMRRADDASLLSHRITLRAIVVRILLDAGRQGDAASPAREARDLASSSGSTGIALIYGADIAEGLLAGDDVDGARALLDTHVELAEKAGAPFRVAQNRRVRALIARREGRDDEAAALFDEAIAGFERTQSPLHRARAERERP